MPLSRDVVAENLDAIRRRISSAALAAGRDPTDVTLVGAAKKVDPTVIRWAAEAGLEAVGENYAGEMAAARPSLEDLPLRWHFIGTLQSGTAHRVADLSDVVETVAGERAARRLARRAAHHGRTVDVLVEVDFTEGRAGAAPDDLKALADVVAGLDGLRLRGLMTIPPPTPAAEGARPWFVRLRELRDVLRRDHPEVLDLSMGMSLDYQVAVQEGATMVRIGTALFGPRTP
jgi:PLP dependent protein